jgi:hypothetical protein
VFVRDWGAEMGIGKSVAIAVWVSVALRVVPVPTGAWLVAVIWVAGGAGA